VTTHLLLLSSITVSNGNTWPKNSNHAISSITVASRRLWDACTLLLFSSLQSVSTSSQNIDDWNLQRGLPQDRKQSCKHWGCHLKLGDLHPELDFSFPFGRKQHYKVYMSNDKTHQNQKLNGTKNKYKLSEVLRSDLEAARQNIWRTLPSGSVCACFLAAAAWS